MLKTETYKKNSNIMKIIKFTGAFGGGFVLAGASISGVESFAGISFAGALPLPLSASVLVGSILRYIIMGNIPSSIVQISSIIICLIYKMFFDTLNSPKYCGLSTGIAVIASGIGVSAVIGELLYKLIFYLFYGILAGACAYSITIIISSLRHRLVLDLSSYTSCAYAVVYTILIASLCSAKPEFLNIGIISGVAVTLTASYHYRCTGGAICGALTVCGAFMADTELGLTIITLPVSALLTGYLHRRKSVTASVFFLGVSFLFSVFTSSDESTINILLNNIVGSLIFLFISQNFSDKWINTGTDGGELPNILALRMSFLSDSIETVRQESEKISDVLAKNKREADIAEKIRTTICESCNNRLICWNSTNESIHRGINRLKRNIDVHRRVMPTELKECLRKKEIAEKLEQRSRENAAIKMLELSRNENRRMLSEQIRIIEDITESAGRHIDLRFSESVSRMIMQKLCGFGFKPLNVTAYYNPRNRLLAELYFTAENTPESCVRICDLIADELKMKLDYIEPMYSGKTVRIRVFERPKYSLAVYAAALSAEKSAENGDTTAVFSDGTGISYVVLSDGMGNGKSAAIESKMVVMLFRKLIGSGISCKSAVRLINSIMINKSHEEGFATLDAVRIDLDTCDFTITKSGASATLIRHRGQVMKITSQSFPVGIISEADAFIGQYEIEQNDIIIMFSDGVNENEYQFIKELLLSSSDLKYIVSEIFAKAKIFNQEIPQDDMTVIGIRVDLSK